MNLNLTANGKAQELILAYLKENASETLAEKINKGTPFTKDGKTLINKKTLDDFMKYANGEAKKLAEKGANAACIEDNVVYGWAIHYFEEDSIEGTLYNEDGTEYKPVVKAVTKPTTTITPPKPAPKPQMSIFDMMTGESAENSDNSSILPPQSQITVKTETQPEKVIAPVISADKPKKQPSPFYQTYLKLVERHKGFLILLRLGDFYEAMNDHATTLASELNLTLTGRDVGLDERVPIIGIPYHAIDSYVNKIIERGYKVILAENLDDVLEFKDIDENDISDNSRRKQNRAFAQAQPNLRKLSPQQVNACDLFNSEPQQSQAEGSALSSRNFAGASSREICENEIEELSEEEMRQFDSYVDEEPDEIPTVSKIVGPTDDSENVEGCNEIMNAESAKAFDKEAICIISDLLDGEVTLF